MKKKRILYVDDNSDSRFVVTTILELSGYEIVTAKTAAEGLSLARTEPFDLFLLDNKLPGASGLELCWQIRAFDPHTPILFYSGASREIDKRLARQAGAQGFLIKPIGAEELVRHISELVSQKNLESEEELSLESLVNHH